MMKIYRPFLRLLLAAGIVIIPAVSAASPGQEKKGPKTESYLSQFLLFGTVFDKQGGLMPGAEIEVRRSNEKKVIQRAVSDRRGEFGIRVPMGAEYEVKVKAKGFAEQVRKVDARNGARLDMVFRMGPGEEKKK
ncbi:MAG: carboxypeptidase regulatory-like domain-containing protein [Acidobacteria bacterium]|nr:carboxypeptidase regulatory-like domain-containing protein [Acidobacteriota bacterium]